MAGFDLPVRAIREQIASAIDLILQVDRMPDGRRVITAVTEVQGLEGDTILLQDIFKYRQLPGAERQGRRRAGGHRPAARSSSTSSPRRASRCRPRRSRPRPAPRPGARRPPPPAAARSGCPPPARSPTGSGCADEYQLLAMLLVGGGLALLVDRAARARLRARGAAGRHPRPALGRARRRPRRRRRAALVASSRTPSASPAGSSSRSTPRAACSRCSSRPGSRCGPASSCSFVVSGGVVLGVVRRRHHRRASPFGLVGAHRQPVPRRSPTCSRRIARRKRKFEEQFPDALTLIALVAVGRPHVPAVDPDDVRGGRAAASPRSSPGSCRETQLGDPLVDALERMAQRLDVRDVDWVVQAIRIQQTVGGKLADLLHTLADFIRAREEIRREIDVLTAEGKVSAYVLGAPPALPRASSSRSATPATSTRCSRAGARSGWAAPCRLGRRSAWSSSSA